MTEKNKILPSLFQTKTKKALDSLTLLFKSEFFDAHMLFHYLYNDTRIGVQDMLINKLINTPTEVIEFYLNQICVMVFERPENSSLEKFLYDSCILYPNIALQVYWIFNSYIQEDHQYKRGMEIIQKLENNLVNRKSSLLENVCSLKENELNIYLEKSLREDYFQKQLQFTQNLINFSTELKLLEGEKRTETLKFSLEKINLWLENNLRKAKFEFDTVFKHLYRGVIWPICRNRIKMIVGVVTDLAHCFSTKSRTPIKIVFETIELNESVEWENLVSDDKNSKKPLSISLTSKPIIINLEDAEKTKAKNIEAFKDFAQNVLIQEKKMEKKAKKENRIIMLDAQKKGFSEKKDKALRQRSFSHYDGTEGEVGKEIDALQYRITEKAIEHIINKIGTKQENSIFQSPIVEDRGNEATHYISLEERLEGMADPFGEKWGDIVFQAKSKSKFGKFNSYELKSIIVKTNDNLKQEQLAMQIFTRLQEIYSEAKIRIFIKTYNIIVTSMNSGFIDCINDTISLDALKKKFPKPEWTIDSFYRKYFYDKFEEAQKNFVESLAGYSILIYLLNIKDRHNGNILIDSVGHIIHIDFGFFITNSPGSISFETSPFKLTQEYIDLMDGEESPMFEYFKALLVKGLFELRKHIETILLPLEIMQNCKLPCFSGGPWGLIEIKKKFTRFSTEQACIKLVEDLIYESKYNWRTIQYDNFQKLTNNIYP